MTSYIGVKRRLWIRSVDRDNQKKALADKTTAYNNQVTAYNNKVKELQTMTADRDNQKKALADKTTAYNTANSNYITANNNYKNAQTQLNQYATKKSNVTSLVHTKSLVFKAYTTDMAGKNGAWLSWDISKLTLREPRSYQEFTSGIIYPSAFFTTLAYALIGSNFTAERHNNAAFSTRKVLYYKVESADPSKLKSICLSILATLANNF